MNSKPLSGIKVVELTTYVAAPICGRMLATMGADVIKIESTSGDPWRAQGRSCGYSVSTQDENPNYEFYNTGKKDIALNLKNPDGMEVLMKLLSDADVFITNTRAKSLKKLGIDYESLKERFPSLIYATITGYGEKGPDAAAPGFDNVAFWCVPGYMSDMSYAENPYPVKPATGAGDTASGTNLYGGIVTALFARERTGKGDYITVSLYNSAIWMMNGMITPKQEKYAHGSPDRISRFSGLPFCSAYPCSDGELFMLSIVDIGKQMFDFYDIMGRSDLRDDPEFNTSDAAVKNKKALFAIVDPIFKTQTCQYWLDAFKAKDIVCCKMGHFSEVCKSEQAWANDYLEYYTFRNGEQCIFPTMPMKLNSVDSYASPTARLCGEDTAAVLTDLGYSEEQIAAMLAAGAAK